MNCIHHAQVEDYLMHRLDSYDTLQFEAHLLDCEDCRKEVERLRNIMVLIQRSDSATSLEDGFKKKTLFGQSVTLKVWMLAASIILLLGATVLTTRLIDTGDKQEIAMLDSLQNQDSLLAVMLVDKIQSLKQEIEHKETYAQVEQNKVLAMYSFDPPFYSSLTTRSELTAFDYAMKHYNKGEYEQAISYFDKSIAAHIIHDDLVYYYGLSCFALGVGETEESNEYLLMATKYLTAIAANSESPNRFHAKWYIALINLYNNDTATCIKLLEELQKRKGQLGKQARQLHKVLIQ